MLLKVFFAWITGRISKIYSQARFEATSSVSESETSLLTLLWRRVLGLGVGPKLLAERPRNNSTGLETLLVIINDDIVASPEKGKHQVVIHLIHKRLSSWDNDFNKMRRRFINRGRKISNWVVNFNNNFSIFLLHSTSIHLARSKGIHWWRRS